MAKKKIRRNQAIPENETDAARFIRVVSPRVSKAVKSIEVIGFCSGSGYEYTQAQVKQIHDTLFDAMVKMVKRFSGNVEGSGGFSFKD